MSYKLYNDDCVNVCSQLPDDCIDLTITSIPFANLYTYSDDPRDFSNVKDLDEFFAQMNYLIPELYRITRPGRIIALHLMQIPTFKGRDGAMGLIDFRGMVIKAFQKHGWIFHGEITVFKDPQIEATRTKSASILWNSYKKFAEITRTGMPDYVVLMQKVEREDEWIHVTHDNIDDEFHQWTRFASPCWGIGKESPKVSRTNVLNTKVAREKKDEKHMTPLQLDLIEHLIKWYTNENIDMMLMERHLNKKARRGSNKNHIKGPKKRTEEDDVRFAQSFEKLILMAKSKEGAQSGTI